jgi:hypothetical protein
MEYSGYGAVENAIDAIASRIRSGYLGLARVTMPLKNPSS